MLMCKEPLEEWRCIRYCNPNECQVLNEKKCICVTDPVCEAEKEKFCGGDLGDCKCKEEDGGSWCSALTGDSIKTWKFAFAYDTLNNEIITDDIMEYIWANLQGSYRIDHIYYSGGGSSTPEVFSWKFDNMHQPLKIQFNCIERYGQPCWTPIEYERTIIKLNTDTLILTWPWGNELKGWIAYIPNDDYDLSQDDSVISQVE